MFALRYCILVLLLTASALANGQELIKGIVLDSATFAPLPFVNIRVKNQPRGTTTDTKGNFGFMAYRTDTLVFSYLGYQDVIFPLNDWEPSIIRMSEKSTLLNQVLIRSKLINPYEGLFDDQNAIINKRKIPFYLPKYKKEKIKVSWLLDDNIRAKTYVDLLIKDNQMKLRLMGTYKLSEDEYYLILSHFNEQNVNIMYHLTMGELMTLLDNFFAREARQKK
jgi:hypothetical protein